MWKVFLFWCQSDFCIHDFLFLGETISEKDKCKECKGKKVTQQTKVLDVHVDKGMKDNQKIPFRGEGDQLVCKNKI